MTARKPDPCRQLRARAAAVVLCLIAGCFSIGALPAATTPPAPQVPLSQPPPPASAAAPVPGAAPAPAPPVPAAPAPLPPGTALYDVEVVVFRATTSAASEDWSAAPTPRGFGSPGTQPGLDPQVVQVLTPADYRLMGVVDGLRRSGAWRPIAHAAWIQNAPNWGSHVGLPLSAVGVDVPGLTGLVFLERAPLYLHLGFEVNLQDGATYTIDEMHNIRQNEKEYFDHPAFGIIAVVTPLKQPAR